jgi:hypothetical protein
MKKEYLIEYTKNIDEKESFLCKFEKREIRNEEKRI